MSSKEGLENTEVIKRLLITQLVMNGVSIRDIIKITDMSTSQIYKFLPKNLMKIKENDS